MLHQFLSSRGHRNNHKLLNQVLHYLCRSYGRRWMLTTVHSPVLATSRGGATCCFRAQIFGNQKVCMNLRYYLYHCAFNYSVAKAALPPLRAKQYGVSLLVPVLLAVGTRQAATSYRATGFECPRYWRASSKASVLSQGHRAGPHIITDLQESVARIVSSS